MSTYNKNEEEKLNYHIIIAKKITDYWIDNDLIPGNEIDYLYWIEGYLIDKLFWWNCANKEKKAKEIYELVAKCGIDSFIEELRDYDRQQFHKLKKMAAKV